MCLVEQFVSWGTKWKAFFKEIFEIWPGRLFHQKLRWPKPKADYQKTSDSADYIRLRSLSGKDHRNFKRYIKIIHSWSISRKFNLRKFQIKKISSLAIMAWIAKITLYFFFKSLHYTGGPRLVWFLEFWKNRTMRNLY